MTLHSYPQIKQHPVLDEALPFLLPILSIRALISLLVERSLERQTQIGLEISSLSKILSVFLWLTVKIPYTISVMLTFAYVLFLSSQRKTHMKKAAKLET